MSEERPFGNADEAALEPTERRDLIFAVLTMQRSWHEMYGSWLTIQHVEELLTGKRSL